MRYNIDIRYLTVQLFKLHPNSERDLAYEMIFTAALTRSLWPKLVARLTLMCGDSTNLMLRCGSCAASVPLPTTIPTFDDPDLRESLRTAANYFVDDAINDPSRLTAAEFETRLVADCRRRKDMNVSEPWSDGDELAQFYDTINSVQMPPLNIHEHLPAY